MALGTVRNGQLLCFLIADSSAAVCCYAAEPVRELFDRTWCYKLCFGNPVVRVFIERIRSLSPLYQQGQKKTRYELIEAHLFS